MKTNDAEMARRVTTLASLIESLAVRYFEDGVFAEGRKVILSALWERISAIVDTVIYPEGSTEDGTAPEPEMVKHQPEPPLSPPIDKPEWQK